jgi:alkaline phosphatase D
VVTGPSRRLLLGQAAALAGAALLPAAWTPVVAATRLSDDPFTLGVASGEPTSDGMVLWTRLAPKPLDPNGGMPPAPVAVTWEIGEDQGLKRIVRRGRALAVPEAAHSVHVEVAGLKPGREYFYRFTAAGHASSTGRTRTTPALDARPERLRIAYGSCQKYEAGYWSAYDALVADDPDLVLFLGDYIYEGATGKNPLRPHPPVEAHDLATYRTRYGLYKSDPKLQAAHACAPWMVIWDDHEVDNDYGLDQDRTNPDPATFLRRRAAAYQAYYEHMPLRRTAAPVGPDMLLYRALNWGQLAQFQFTDTRQYRNRRTCLALEEGKSIPDCPERTDPARSILGMPQEAWLMQTLASTTAQWNVLAQQYQMGELKRPGPEVRYSNDGWDGYPASRQRIVDQWAKAKVSNPVVLGGDIHCFIADELGADPDHPAASAFVGGSISSLGAPNADLEMLADANPHLRFTEGEKRGYGRVDLTATGCDVTFRAVQDAFQEQSPAFDLAKFHVEAGQAGMHKA